ncbi:hypothetical protein REC12_03660 [Desulfosporosinus sp. PR]|uniref:hypothetical protein n=1 Tax=Candidatus Desulfosporosinus nitrosoreducens TaxID=3401928 RepID=UPI0027E81320|nr:hypothetical protein [Desulfosporosinus sp. PR]MDQ7092676.1 hypothetical protein [Desulfosporosinus sp. PR]
MAILTTGLIDNNPILGLRPAANFQVRISNEDLAIPGTVQITGIRLIGDTVKDTYVLESFAVPPNTAALRNYFADFDAFEFQFVTAGSLEISAWGQDALGDLIAAQRVLPAELNPIV